MPKVVDNKTKYQSLFEMFGATWQLNGSDEAVAAECPFCGKARHCHLNVVTGQYQCKVCGQHGNALSFIRYEYANALGDTTDEDYQRLKLERGLPL